MYSQNFHLRQLEAREAIPYKLLLLADETKEAIDKYIYQSDIYVVYSKVLVDPIGVFALYRVSDDEIEIKNIAVQESFRGQGIGTFLLENIYKIATRDKFRTVLVGTGDAGVREIRFYEKNGFVKYELKKDFYTRNYSKPITENGMVLRDMVMLRKNIG